MEAVEGVAFEDCHSWSDRWPVWVKEGIPPLCVGHSAAGYGQRLAMDLRALPLWIQWRLDPCDESWQQER